MQKVDIVHMRSVVGHPRGHITDKQKIARMHEVERLLAHGFSYPQIAEYFGVCYRTPRRWVRYGKEAQARLDNGGNGGTPASEPEGLLSRFKGNGKSRRRTSASV